MSSNFTPRKYSFSAKRIGCALLLPLCLSASALRAQDAIRPSLAGEASAESRRQSIEQIPYNLLVGPVRFRLSATMGVEYNDNINLSEINEQDDFIFRPQIGLNMLWPVTQLNTLRFDIGLGYSFYAQHSENDTNGVLLAPGSQLSFDVFVGDFRINFHDRFSLQQDPIDEGQISGTADYGRFENYAGVSVLWDLNKAVLTVGYDHYNYIATNDQFNYLDRSAEELSASLSVAVSSTTGVGLESSYVFTNYDKDLLNDNDAFSVGAFVETQISNYLRLRVAGGYQMINFDEDFVLFGPLPPDGCFVVLEDQGDLNDYYVNALLSHRVNSALTHSIAVGHESELGVNSNYVTLNYVRHTAHWNIINRTLLTTELFYEDANDSGGFIDEHFHRYGGALSLGYQLTRHVTLGARYQYTKKDSDVLLRDYSNKRVSLYGTYSF